MTTTQISANIRPGRVAAIVERDGVRLGHVDCKGRTFAASRKVGQAGVDIRRYATGFRSAEAAAAWIAKAAA